MSLRHLFVVLLRLKERQLKRKQIFLEPMQDKVSTGCNLIEKRDIKSKEQRTVCNLILQTNASGI
jgi:hypothetical protein